MAAEHAHDARGLDNPGTHHEESDVNIRGVFGFAIALTIVVIVMLLVVGLFFRYYEARESAKGMADYPLAVPQQDRLPALPRLQSNPRQDLLDLRAQEDRILSSYGWADKNAGAVRIPIDEAIRLTIQRGLPARPGAAPGGPASTGDANSGRMIGELKASSGK